MKIDSYGWFLLAAAAVVLVAGLIGVALVKRKLGRGPAYGLAIGLWVVGFLIPTGNLREMFMLSGVMRMVGFFGAILVMLNLGKKRGGNPPVKPWPPTDAEGFNE